MKYIKFPKLNIKVSRFGMGCMRLPRKKTNHNKKIVDEVESIKMIQYAAKYGVNYFDTAYTYKDSESILGRALKGGLREKVYIATKSPVFLGDFKNPEDFDIYLNEQLKRLKTEYIDFYLLHGLDRKAWEKVKKLKLLDKMDIAKKEGKIKYRAFSFHDNFKLFKEIIDSYSWDMAQIQLNFMGEDYQAGIKGLQYAASRNIGVVIMEPLLGGILGENIPEDIIKKWDSSGLKRTPAEWAFIWLGNFREATVILSGVSNMEQLKEDIKIFDNIIPNSVSQAEEQIVKEVKEVYERKIKVNCTGCSYCMPCPSGVNIPEVFWHYNRSFMSNSESWKKNYRSFFCKNKADASQCSECGQCEEVCPQSIAIIDNLKEAHKYLMS